ncbi:MAG: ATP-binding protein [Bacteroidales bacterium]|nr:ATP-binding protein [Bacteroidales bacterium]
MEENVLFPSLYEKDYIIRSLGAIVNQPDVALTELVANAWDAGASNVVISIPDGYNQILYIEDDGVGMSEDEFQHHWMTLRYNRLKNQGREVVFPNGIKNKRLAFGRNGVGRHGLFCFGEEYKVITQKDGKKFTFTIKPNIEHEPFAVVDKKEESCSGHGTRLEVVVTKNLPKAEKMAEILSARFLHDPQFKITINHISLAIEDLTNTQEPETIIIDNPSIRLYAYFIDTTKAGKKSVFQGIAFWQCGRLVGEPSWLLGQNMVLDGRTTLAKRYTFVIKTDDLSDYIKEDWSGFKPSEAMTKVYDEVEKYVNKCLESVAATSVSIITENLGASIKESLKYVNPLIKAEVKNAIEEIVKGNPKVKQDSVDLVVQTIINLEKSKNGHELLEKLSQLKSEDVVGLNDLLNKWTVNDALTVLNEIDRRLSIITAIKKLSSDKSTDELHVLHPMITESRWLFGPEYESSEYIFNKQMKTAVAKIFGEDKFIKADINYKKRPDLICLPDSTIGVTGIEDITGDINLFSVRKLLLIELKKGGFKITREERNQAQGYVEDLLASNLGRDCQITAYVVGESVADNLTMSKVGGNDKGVVYVTTYDQLVDTAERRMFGLRQVIASRYDDVPGMDLYSQVKLSI